MSFRTSDQPSHAGFLCVLFCAAVGLTLAAPAARAQSDYASTPLALSPGAPAGSYRLSDIDTVNLFNGRVNVYLPLAGISGRGNAKSAVSMVWDSPAGWRVGKYEDLNGNPAYYEEPDYTGQGTINWGGWSSYFTRSVDGAVNACYPGTLPVVQFTLARLHVEEPDGTQHELRDAATGGQKLGNDGGCYSQGPSRGKVFVSTDGSGITVMFDEDIRDGIHAEGDYVTGGGASVMLLPDGRRFKSDGMRDRNGNMLYGSTDSLGRTVTEGIDYSGAGCAARGGNGSDFCRYVSYSGFGGVERRIYVTENSSRATGIFLPNNLSYRFTYNQYGDLTKIELPTGGSIEYDYGPGLDGAQPDVSYWIQGAIPGTYGGGPNDFHVYRRVTERSLYKEGHTLVNRQTFGKPESTQTGNSGFVEKKTYGSDGVTLLSREEHYFYGSANDTFSISDPFAYPAWKTSREYRTKFYDAGGILLRQTDQMWEQRASLGWWTGDPETAPSNDPRIYQTVTRLENNLTSMTAYGFDPDVPYNSQTDVVEYDYGDGSPGALLRHTHTDYVKTAAYIDPPPSGAYLRNLPRQQWVSADAGGANKTSLTAYAYDEFAPADCPNITGHDPAYSTGYATRGNLTSVTRYADASGQAGGVTATMHYDIAGNVVSATDPKGNTTQSGYADSFCNDGGARCDGAFTPFTYAFPSSRTSPVPDASADNNFPAGTFGSTSALTASTVYDFWTGQVYSTTDANGKTTTMEYADPLDRPTAQVRPGASGGRTDIEYAADGRSIRVLSDLDNSRRTEAYQYFDGLGRVVRSQQYENAEAAQSWVTQDTEYDSLGRVKRSSFPYRWTLGTSSPFSTDKWTETSYDALGRVLSVKTQPYAAAVSTAYSGNRVLFSDQIGKEKVSRSDALGRLTDVWEVTAAETGAEASTVVIESFPGHPETASGYLTTYRYDALGNLRMVEQAGEHTGLQVTQRRFFAYDSLGRLVRSKYPEQGDIAADADFPALTDSASGISNSQWSSGYAYDASGNLAKRKDARGVVTSYAYDHLNRNIIATYAGGDAPTPDVRRHYDGAVNGLGRLYWAEAIGVSATVFDTYDSVGRLTQYHQSFWTGGGYGQSYPVTRVYNKAGDVTSETYPSQHVVNYNYDAAGRLGDNGAQQPAFSGTLGDGAQRTYASSILYDPLGGMSQERFGTDTPLYHKLLYNSRGQLAEIRLGTAGLPDTGWQRGAIINHYSNSGWGASGGGADNNGNLRRQEVFLPNFDGSGYDQPGNWTSDTQSYSYDALNRLTSANEASDASWTQSYVYDRWGNRTIDQNATTSNVPKLKFDVDANTNRLGVPADRTGAMNYDADGNLKNDSYTAYGSATGQQTRFYDAENRMVSAQLNPSQSAVYAYDADGRRVKRNDGSGEVWQVYGIDGELVAEYAANAAPSFPQKEYGYRSGQLLITASVSAGWGAAPTLHDNPLVVGQTIVQARHVTELRDAINALRAHKGLAAYSWQTSASSGGFITAAPVLEMRTALDQALGVPSGGYSAGLALGQRVKAIHIQELRDRILGAWQGGAGGVEVNWLVADQLGTPRMVVDKTGSLSGVKRHDYLPFGEEVSGDPNWRTAARGYDAADGVRQKFAGYEHDSETGLDYAQARYFAAAHGRFTGVDPLAASAHVGSPQTWNRYSYALNNPLRMTDPSGMSPNDNAGQAVDIPPQTPPPAQIVVTVDYVKSVVGPFYTCNGTCEEGSEHVPLSPEANDQMMTAIASMATVLANGYSQAAATERTPSETQETTESASAGVSAGASVTAGVPVPSLEAKVENGTSQTNSITHDSTSQIVRNVDVQNDTIQANLALSLSNTRSPVSNQQGTPQLGEVSAVRTANAATMLADLARTRANMVAERFYTTMLSRPLPNAFRYKTFTQELFLGTPRH
jgi:RHS repeat-associated protein